jgi:hypothetical protein
MITIVLLHVLHGSPGEGEGQEGGGWRGNRRRRERGGVQKRERREEGGAKKKLRTITEILIEGQHGLKKSWGTNFDFAPKD